MLLSSYITGDPDSCSPSTRASSEVKPNESIGSWPLGHDNPTAAPVSAGEASLGRHLARRLVQVGVSDVFAVPGDFNLTLLDHLIAEPGLRLVGCCNELNAGYARACGVGACAVTFTIGGLSVLNAIAGAYSENLPVICIASGPNSNDYGTNRILHHTIGVPDFSQELRCFQTITCHQAVVTNLDDAHEQIDTAVATALRESKPVYLSISCNLPGLIHPTFSRDPVPFFLTPRYEFQMQYGSIGWSVGALFGYAQGANDKRDSLGCVDDVAVRAEQHKLPDQQWGGQVLDWKVKCEEELTAAIETALGEKQDSLCFIEVIAHKDDTSKELLEWGSRVSAANSRLPNPQ
ncbi:hypothetical protein ACQ4PT_027504 [Festuca glaucescens]